MHFLTTKTISNFSKAVNPEIAPTHSDTVIAARSSATCGTISSNDPDVVL